jgi:hypothetical protein
VPLQPVDGAWTLDLDALLAAVTPAPVLLVVNAPNNPTGWTLTRAEQQAILDHCRRTGTWILADEVYERCTTQRHPNGCAPSFLDIAEPDDRLVVVHSFSKSFLMTGWRLGWLVMPPATWTPHMGKLHRVQHLCAPACSCSAPAGGAGARPTWCPVWWPPEGLPRPLVGLLQALPGVQVAAGPGRHVRLLPRRAPDSLAWPSTWWPKHGLGLAPGAAFAPEARAGCAGALRRATWAAGRRAWSDWRRGL